ncbi:MAG: hypothetical protein ABIP75_12785 [Pyrinomonadaceae bacterium]
MKSPLILVSTVIALGTAALVVWVWGTRPEPPVMLFVGAGFVLVGWAARRFHRQNSAATATEALGVTES